MSDKKQGDQKGKTMTQIIHGKAQGRTIILDKPLELALGQEVEVIVRPINRTRPRGDGIRNSTGALAGSWSESDDCILAEVQADWKLLSRQETPE